MFLVFCIPGNWIPLSPSLPQFIGDTLPARFFQVFEAGVEDIFDAAEFGAPDFPHVVEALIDSGFEGCEAGAYHSTEDHQHYGVRDYRNADGEVELGVRHTG